MAVNDAHGWQPISTAPRDALRFTDRVLLARWVLSEDTEGNPAWFLGWVQVAVLMPAGWSVTTAGWGSGGHATIPLHGATHWQPLPAPPPTTQEGGRDG